MAAIEWALTVELPGRGAAEELAARWRRSGLEAGVRHAGPGAWEARAAAPTGAGLALARRIAEAHPQAAGMTGGPVDAQERPLTAAKAAWWVQVACALRPDPGEDDAGVGLAAAAEQARAGRLPVVEAVGLARAVGAEMARITGADLELPVG